MGVAGPMIIGGSVLNYSTLWNLSWPNQVSNYRTLTWGGCPLNSVVGMAQQPNSQYLYTLHANGAGCGYSAPASDYHINQVVAATGVTYLGPQLMLAPGKALTFKEGDIAVDPEYPNTLLRHHRFRSAVLRTFAAACQQLHEFKHGMRGGDSVGHSLRRG